ncbi:MAG: hypothetical protein KAG53_12280 [Endozoicomonadaceae bacterium]|nr:hypothetical protein [Endozoicomonadaceae bacterium]
MGRRDSRKYRRPKHLRFTTDAESGVKHGRLMFIATGTPSDENGSAD